MVRWPIQYLDAPMAVRRKRTDILQSAINVCNRKIAKTAVAHSNGNQLVGLIFLLMVLGALSWGSWVVISWMRDPHRLPLSRLVIAGERYYTTDNDIRQAILSLGMLGTFMTQDIKVIQSQIEQIPWIKHVSVRKQWPDKLTIYVMEYIPVARWNDVYLLDNRGKVFNTPLERISNEPMPMLYGPDNSEQDALTGYRTMNEILITAKLQLKAVKISVRYSWELTLKDGTRLELGRQDKIRRLQRFIAIYPILLQQARNDHKRINYVDLRYDSGLAVGWSASYIEPENSNQQQT